jgi:AraC-like DNA-binding protein
MQGLQKASNSLIDIALDCGFSSHGHFSNTFRRIVGVAPRELGEIVAPIARELAHMGVVDRPMTEKEVLGLLESVY